MKDEALDNLKAMGSVSIQPKSSPSPVQAFLGGITAGVIALILYKFTLTIEAALNRQTISDNFSVRQITITVRTVVNGLCYLATFVFGINSIGLFLLSGQLAINSSVGESHFVFYHIPFASRLKTQLQPRRYRVSSADGAQASYSSKNNSRAQAWLRTSSAQTYSE